MNVRKPTEKNVHLGVKPIKGVWGSVSLKKHTGKTLAVEKLTGETKGNGKRKVLKWGCDLLNRGKNVV